MSVKWSQRPARSSRTFWRECVGVGKRATRACQGGASAAWFDDYGESRLRPFGISSVELVSLNFASWNQIGIWLRRLDGILRAASREIAIASTTARVP